MIPLLQNLAPVEGLGILTGQMRPTSTQILTQASTTLVTQTKQYGR